MKSAKIWLTLLLATTLITACSKDKDDKGQPPKQTPEESIPFETQAREMSSLKVVDSAGQPIVGVEVLVGRAQNSPFTDNFIVTDDKGVFKAPASWVNPEMITLSAKGYIRATYLDQKPEGQTYTLRLAATANRYELKGKGTGFSVKDGDGLIDFAIMIPAMQKRELFHFNVDQIMSPESDEISVLGQKADVPSNLSLPRQKETYVLGFTLDKPVYRMYFDQLGEKKIYTVRGQFPHKAVIKGFQDKKKFTELINHFSIQGGSLKTANIAGATQNMDLPVNELSFTQKQTMQAPAFSANEAVLAAAVSEYQSLMLPTDFKNLESNKPMALATAAGSNPFLLSVLMSKADIDNKKSGRISAALYPFKANIQPEMLPLLDEPQITNKTQVTIRKVAATANVTPHATYSILSRVTEKPSLRAGKDKNKDKDKEKVEIVTQLWEVYASGWSEGFTLPQWPNEAPMKGNMRWDVSLLGTQGIKKLDFNAQLFDSVTHATHNSVDFQ